MTEAKGAAAQLQTLRAQIDGDWAAARHSAAEALRIRGRARRLAREKLYAAALMVHYFYTAVEAILERVATALDRTPPSGAAWHKELLDRAALEIRGVRPAIITRALRQDLDEYRRFRHVVRHAYEYVLEWEKLRPLMDRLPAVVERLDEALARFRQFLDGAARELERGD